MSEILINVPEKGQWCIVFDATKPKDVTPSLPIRLKRILMDTHSPIPIAIGNPKELIKKRNADG